MQMTIYDAATVGSRSNCVYPNPVTVTDADTMRQAAAFDHVCAAYKQNYRSVDNFLKADCLPMDCDNDHSDDPDDWLTPFDVAMDFPGVGMIFVYSKSHMKQKGKRGPRPRFHVYFICTETTNSEIYSSWKDRLIADYPYFDDGAKDSARFLFGVKNAAVEVYDGEITIDEFLADSFAEWDAAQGQIPEGSRNKTMSHYAGRIIKRLGNTEEAHKQFLKEAEKCSPPLDDAELAGIWGSAVKFGAKVAAQEGYIPPEQYKRFLGYDRGPNGGFVVNQEQAKTVKLIYKLFLDGLTCHAIAKELTGRNLPTPGGKAVWSQTTVRSILTNEKYKGDALLQKEFTVDFLQKKTKKNEGEVPQYYVEGNHEAIIDPVTFDYVQAEMARRTKDKHRYSGVNMFSSKIKCGECGCWYGSKVWHSTDKYRRIIYQCNHKYKGGKPCSTPHITEEQIKDAFVRAVNILLSEKDELGVNVRAVIAMLCDSAELEKRQAELKEELEVVVGLVERCVAENARTALNQDEYSERYNGLVSRYEAVKTQFDEVTQAVANKADRKKLLEQFLQTVETQEPVAEFDERLWSSLVDFVTVHGEKDIRVTFKDGTEIQI